MSCLRFFISLPFQVRVDHKPAKSGKNANSIENETNGCNTAAPAVPGAVFSTAIAGELALSTTADEAAATALKKSEIIMPRKTVD